MRNEGNNYNIAQGYLAIRNLSLGQKYYITRNFLWQLGHRILLVLFCLVILFNVGHNAKVAHIYVYNY